MIYRQLRSLYRRFQRPIKNLINDKGTGAIIVEDMPEAVQLLMSDINTYCKNIKVTGAASSVVTAAKLLRQEIPDILFLDISLGDGTGFDLLEIIPTLKTHIIFIAAHKEFALRAFRYSASDYLLKPHRC